ncbi:MAG TPA: hypothetical protein VGB17_11795 [Pyrinomonadaceae bacterium]
MSDDETQAKPDLSRRGKVAMALSILASLSFFTTALVIFIREGDWPAKYISAGLTILAITFIAVRRRASRGR